MPAKNRHLFFYRLSMPFESFHFCRLELLMKRPRRFDTARVTPAPIRFFSGSFEGAMWRTGTDVERR